MVDGRKKFRGELQSVAGESVVMTADGKEFTMPFDTINHGKLILTDALIDAHMAKVEAAKAKNENEAEENAE